MPNGPMSQSLNATTIAAQAILTYQNLPPEVASVQTAAKQFLDQTRPQIIRMQQDVLGTIEVATPTLNKARQILSSAQGNPTPEQIQQVSQLISSVQTNFQQLLPTVEATTQANTAFYNQMLEADRQLAVQSANLNAQKVQVQSQLDSYQSELQSIQSKMKYFGLLGLAGIPGLIAMGVLLGKAQSNVNDYSGKVNDLNQQLNQLNNSINQVSQLTQNTQVLVNATLPVRNAVNIVSSDITEILNDLQHANTAATMLFLNTALTELQVLANDAS
ncbi:chromosome segregation ATPase [Chitinivorax tropicus]|uniref:Chromosome segregation ATPase n=1 Tax=Chitinivorax tropicus TaxID=714531 RepID=A0A840MVU8_9PROT|nr:hypothetical protein [Chitinivorax tropicus]MBB5019301.1 chromosome segregation ATPase [Chitinivorax tropicus]